MEVMRFEKLKNAKSLTNGTYKRSVLEKNAVQFERFVKYVEKIANFLKNHTEPKEEILVKRKKKVAAKTSAKD